ncbi:hypothetical protein Dsin_012072 [Dipteronia sinensis]|uniref:Uncharacterized protein n=1 Tax=Dipteronia sinensis TaxID=43782 RepID=A0AAE0AHE4_9ROSI|nr:hypothetical protein Dsin_012072 [Dipteronia sinensis]
MIKFHAMVLVVKQKGLMRRRSELACLYLLLLLMLLQLETSCCTHHDHDNHIHGGYSRFNRFNGGSGSHQLPAASSYGAFKGNNVDNKNGDDEIFGADKRKVYTGPNPLHNR